MKKKLLALVCALVMIFSLASCGLSTPDTVGKVGDFEVSSGLYLLAQYSAYQQAAQLVGTDQDATDVKAFLKETITTDADSGETAVVQDYVADKTLETLRTFAAIDARFAELGGELTAEQTQVADNYAQQLMDQYGSTYTANGIGLETLKAFERIQLKHTLLLTLVYGPDGESPVDDSDLTEHLDSQMYELAYVNIPLYNTSTFVFASDDQKAQIEAIAAQCQAELNEQATAETASNSALYTAAMTYLPQAMSVLGSTMESAQAVYYAGSQLYTPKDLASFGSDSYNDLTDPLDEVPLGSWTTIDLGTTMLVARRIDPFKTYTVDEMNSMYDMLTSMKSDEIQSKLYADGAALEHNLNTSAINTYSASKIKKTVK